MEILTLKNKKVVLMSLLGFAAAGLVYVLLADIPEAARRMAFIFSVAAFFWAFEVIPLYATALLVVILETFLLCRPGGVLSMDEGGYEVFLMPLGSSIIIILLGGFVLARAMSKFGADAWLAGHLLRLFGHRPFGILLGFMTTTALISMWMTITASSVMMLALVLPLVKQMRESEKFRKALLLSVPLAATVGALGTPVATPPNILAMANLADLGIFVTFFDWMKLAMPLVVVLVIIVSVMLFCLFPPGEKHFQLQVPSNQKLNHQAVLALIIIGCTVLLWMTSGWHKIPSAMIAILSMGLLAGFGLLDHHDFRSIEWDILILMWGGLALGEGLQLSGLSQWIISQPVFAHEGIALMIIFVLITAVLSMFMSNTATANLILPLAVAVPKSDPLLLIPAITFTCSLAILLPVSTPGLAMVSSTKIVKNSELILTSLMFSVIGIVLTILWLGFAHQMWMPSR